MYTQGHNKQNSTNRQKGLRQNKLKMHQSSKAVQERRKKAEDTYYTWAFEP